MVRARGGLHHTPIHTHTDTHVQNLQNIALLSMLKIQEKDTFKTRRRPCSSCVHVLFLIRNRTHALVLEFIIFNLNSSTTKFLKLFLSYIHSLHVKVGPNSLWRWVVVEDALMQKT